MRSNEENSRATSQFVLAMGKDSGFVHPDPDF
jgi:hypothetical protein